MKILADASLPGLVESFPKPFEITLYHQQDAVADLLNGQEILLCRSTLNVNSKLLKNHGLRFVATASSGIDHLDQGYLQSQNIQIIDAKGSNAISVADYVMASIAYLQKYKNFMGLKAGIIGMGAVGSQVYARLKAINYDMVCYDPPKAAEEPDFKSCILNDILSCDLICVHPNLHEHPPYPSRNLLDEPALSLIRPNTAIINASRGDIVSESALLNLKKPIFYCTDVFTNEPDINKKIVDFATLCTPHIAGHSLEAKLGAVTMVSEKLHRLYKLALPNYPELTLPESKAFNQQDCWQDHVLALYNPIDETTSLKSSKNIQESFLQLRKAHCVRYDFLTEYHGD